MYNESSVICSIREIADLIYCCLRLSDTEPALSRAFGCAAERELRAMRRAVVQEN